MSPEKRRRLLSTPYLGFSPFLRSLSRVSSPLHKCTSTSPLSLKSEHRPSPSDRTDRRGSPNNNDDADDDEEDGDDDDEEDEGEGEETVQVDFGFFDPKPGDFHGVKLLLQRYLDDRTWDLSGFVDLILDQTTVGSVVKSDDGEDGEDGTNVDDDGLYAVISALNLERYASHQSIKEVKEYLLGACKEEALKAELGSLLEEKAKDVGLLVCERFLNFPNQAVLPLYNGLFDEVGWATEDEPTQEKRDSFCFEFYLVVSRIYLNKNADTGKHRAKALAEQKNKISGRHRGENIEDELIVYIKAEDEIFHKLSSLNFTFDLSSAETVPSEMKNYRKKGLVMVVESKKIPTFQEELTHMVES